MTQMNSLNHHRMFGRDITNLITHSRQPILENKKLNEKPTRAMSTIIKIDHITQKYQVKDSMNLQMVPKYIQQIFSYTLTKQRLEYSNLKQSGKYSITFTERSKILSSMVETHLRLKLMPQTLYIGIWILDKSLSEGLTIKKGYMESVGIVALFIAAKYEQTYRIPKMKDLILKTGIVMNEHEILQMEGKMMQILKFNLTIESSFHFLEAINKVTDNQKKNLHLAQFLIELSLFDERMGDFKESQIGCAAYYLASKIQQSENPWPRTLKQLTKYSQKDLIKCTKALMTSHQDCLLCPQISPVRRKFSGTDFNEVSSIKFDRKKILNL